MITRMQIGTVVVAGLLASCSSQPAAMGTYVASDTNGGVMVQITSVHDGLISGNVAIVAANDDGKNLAGTRPFSGTIEGKALNLSIENGTGVTMATGTLEGDNLRLTLFWNGKSSELNFVKSSAEKFNDLATASRVRAAEKKQENESAVALNDRMEQRSRTQRLINQLADSAFAKAGEVSEKSRKLTVVIAGYQAVRDRTGKMQSAKRTIDGNTSEGSFRINQIDYQIDTLVSGMGNMHSGWSEPRVFLQI